MSTDDFDYESLPDYDPDEYRIADDIEDIEEEYEIICRDVIDTDFYAIEFIYPSNTPIWTVMEEVGLFFEEAKLPSAEIYHMYTESYDDGTAGLIVIYVL